MQNWKRSGFVALLFCTWPSLLLAADWPHARPIRIVVPAGVGSSPDITSRKIASFLIDRLGQQIVVENKPGGSGSIAMQVVASANSDGYTLGFGNIVSMAINRALLPRLPYNPDKDLLPIVALSQVPNVLVVNKGLAAGSMREFIELAKSRPGKLAMGSGGNGTTSHLSGEILKEMTGINFLHVPYRSAPQALTDLLGGQVDFMFDNITSMANAARNGQVRPLAVTGSKRSALLPDVLTLQEAGLKRFEVVAWGGFVAPAGTPRAVIDRLNREINAWLQHPTTQAEFAQEGRVALGGSPEYFGTFIQSEVEKWAVVIKKIGVKID